MEDDLQKPLLDMEIAGIDRDLAAYFAGELLLPREDKILADRGDANLELYERILQDDQVKSCLQQRFTGLISCPWKVKAASNSKADRRAADWCRELVEKLKFKDIVRRKLCTGDAGNQGIYRYFTREPGKVY